MQDSSTDILIDDDLQRSKKLAHITSSTTNSVRVDADLPFEMLICSFHKAVRHEIAEVMQAVWNDPTHRSAMMNFTS